jgi:purine-nucleoside/S-methyl-5'-thioadenosine phosphorylase / adenosine deaminase
MNRRFPPPHAVRDLAFGEDALDEPIAVPFDGGDDAGDVGSVDAKSDDGGHPIMILPRPHDSFEWRETAFGPALVCPELDAVASHLFTTRLWALGRQGSQDSAWRDVPAAFARENSTLIRMKQVHGRMVVIADDRHGQPASPLPEADIVLAREPGRVIAVQAADCVPLLIADRRLGVVAAAHAGWRGLALGVPEAAVSAMVQTYGSRAADLVAAIGPSVGACCYEVGPDVFAAFETGGFVHDQWRGWFTDRPAACERNPPMPGLPSAPRPGHAFFDGWQAAIDQLLAAEVPRAQIFCARLCTASHPEVLCSYRRDGIAAGRIAGAITPARRR